MAAAAPERSGGSEAADGQALAEDDAAAQKAHAGDHLTGHSANFGVVVQGPRHEHVKCRADAGQGIGPHSCRVLSPLPLQPDEQAQAQGGVHGDEEFDNGHRHHDSRGLGNRQAASYNRSMKKKVIFVCSANYYRSRYAEYYFNWLARREELGWRADSRGLMVGKWGNIGPMSQPYYRRPGAAGDSAGRGPRDPKPLTLADLAEADLVVAVKEAEHRAMVAEQFPLWKDRIEYWHVDDLDCVESHVAIPHLESQIHGLVERLRAENGRHGHDGNEAGSRMV